MDRQKHICCYSQPLQPVLFLFLLPVPLLHRWVVVSCTKDMVTAVTEAAKTAGITTTILGAVSNGTVQVNGVSWGTIHKWKNLYDTAIEELINQFHV